MASRVYLLGGYQSDFADNWARSGLEIADAMRATILRGLTETNLAAGEIEVAHIGNFASELFCNQGHLGGLFAASDPAFAGIPASRHEGACASGSLALLAASADIEAGRYGLAAVLGLEQMRNVPGEQAARLIGGPAMWHGHEYQDARYPWVRVFSDVTDEYDRRYGLKQEYLSRIAQINFANARRNANAQTRRWTFKEHSFSEDDVANPIVEGRTRKQDCGQITDGAAIVFLASEERAHAYAKRLGIALDALPRIKGWGHRTAPMTYAAKIEASEGQPYIFPHVRGAITDASACIGRWRKKVPAGMTRGNSPEPGRQQLQGARVHRERAGEVRLLRAPLQHRAGDARLGQVSGEEQPGRARPDDQHVPGGRHLAPSDLDQGP